MPKRNKRKLQSANPAGTKLVRKTQRVGLTSRYEKQRGADGTMRGGVISQVFTGAKREQNLREYYLKRRQR